MLCTRAVGGVFWGICYCVNGPLMIALCDFVSLCLCCLLLDRQRLDCGLFK